MCPQPLCHDPCFAQRVFAFASSPALDAALGSLVDPVIDGVTDDTDPACPDRKEKERGKHRTNHKIDIHAKAVVRRERCRRATRVICFRVFQSDLWLGMMMVVKGRCDAPYG